MRIVQANAELAAFTADGDGLVFNDFASGPTGAQHNVLHWADCPQVGRMLDLVRPQNRPSVRKLLFSTLDEAQSWLVTNRGPEGQGWKRCGTCQADRAGSGNRARPRGEAQPATDGTGADTAAPPRALPRPTTGSWPASAVFAMPSSQPLRLPVPPRLASWNKAGDPDQVRLAGYLDAAENLLSPYREQLRGLLALRLDVGLPRSAALLDERDLDNYLLPLAARLSRVGPGTLACVWGTKQHSDSSLVRIEHALPAPAVPPPGCCYTVRTSASSQSPAFKEQIRAQLSAARPVPPGPVRMQLGFTVGPRRNWLNLWKPVIDALGQILGRAPGAGPWSPLDGRIVDLGLHCRVKPSIANDVIIDIAVAGGPT
jgi:hypothetical protein